ncbi:hypothetical protein VCHA53O466_50408 [Vibrio chagasii]|nr:hypothetical protein VCHA53O466_50408 [Vibrio chagasii]
MSRRIVMTKTELYGVHDSDKFTFESDPTLLINGVFLSIGESSEEEVEQAITKLSSAKPLTLVGEIQESEVSLDLNDSSVLSINPYSVVADRETTHLLNGIIRLCNDRVPVESDYEEGEDTQLPKLSKSAIDFRDKVINTTLIIKT